MGNTAVSFLASLAGNVVYVWALICVSIKKDYFSGQNWHEQQLCFIVTMLNATVYVV